jgi:AcrR family transcriptional regulator
MARVSGLREKKNLAVKQAFFDAAMELFKEKGFDSTSVDEIAERAGFSRATYFNHFGTKRGVLRFYGQRLQQRLEASFGEHDPSVAPLDSLRELLLAMAGEADAHTEDLKLVYLNSRYDKEYLGQPTPARVRVFEMVERLLLEAQKRRQVRSDLAARELAYHILAVYQGAVLASIAGFSRAVPLLESGWSFVLDGVHDGNSLAE